MNLTEYGFYGWKQDVVVSSNATMYPDTISGTKYGRAPADIILVLDASGSMFFQPYDAGQGQDQNVLEKTLSGSIPPSPGWQTVGTIDYGEIPTQFVAILTSSQNLGFQMMNGSSSTNERLLVSYINATGTYIKTIPVSADSYVRSNFQYSNRNFGTAQTLEVSGYRNDMYRTWLKFDISSIPSGDTIVSAQLSLYISDNYNGRSYLLQHSTTTSWGETTITWNNQPTSFSQSHSANAPSGGAQGYISWDVTTDMQQDYAAKKQYISWAVRDSSENSFRRSYIIMPSKEGPQGIPGFNLLQSQSSNGQKLIYSTSDGSALPGSVEGSDFGKTNMFFYGKNGKWMIQLQNTGQSNASYNIVVQARKLDCVRNAATNFLRLLKPNLDRLAIVEYGERTGSTYYYAAQISKASNGSPFYTLNVSSDFQAALNDISWRNPDIDKIGYGFENYGTPGQGNYWWGGYTPLGAGLEVGNRLFNGTLGARNGSQRLLILITDGKENVKPNPPVPAPPGGPGIFYNPTKGVPSTYYSIASNLTGDAVKASGVTTYTIGFGKDADNYSLTQLAQLGHGQYYYASNGSQLSSIFGTIAYSLKDTFQFHFSLTQEFDIGINTLSNSSITVYFWDATTQQRHQVVPSKFGYQGGGNFMVTTVYTGSKDPDAIDIIVKDPRGIIVRLRLDLQYWGS
jgi:hypothetical protein